MILLVNDDADVNYTLTQLLSFDGLTCQSAQDAEEALRIVRNHPAGQPLLLLIDMRMPRTTGLDLLRQIRANPAIASTPAAMLSATEEPEVRQQAAELGAWDYLLLGSDMDQLLAKIGNLYARAKQS
jgi:CheY-like chemotaxis protein